MIHSFNHTTIQAFLNVGEIFINLIHNLFQTCTFKSKTNFLKIASLLIYQKVSRLAFVFSYIGFVIISWNIKGLITELGWGVLVVLKLQVFEIYS